MARRLVRRPADARSRAPPHVAAPAGTHDRQLPSVTIPYL
jgi:hypothetical protein